MKKSLMSLLCLLAFIAVIFAGCKKDKMVVVGPAVTDAKPGEELVSKIQIDGKDYDKTSMIVVMPAMVQINMSDDSSWSSYLGISDKKLKDDENLKDDESLKGVFTKGRSITLSPFAIGAYEVTQDLYKAVMLSDSTANAEPSAFKGQAGFGPESEEIQSLRPVESISWYDAVYFCNALTKATMSESDCVYTITEIERSYRESIAKATVTQDLSKKGYRLPTETEWEFAARGGNPNSEAWMYAFAGSPAKNNAKIYDGKDFISEDENFETLGWYYYNAGFCTHEAGLKKPNTLGLYDMSGNVAEWCYDLYGELITDTETNPSGLKSGDWDRVLRGGAHNGGASNCLVSHRQSNSPKWKIDYYGFRVCRSL